MNPDEKKYLAGLESILRFYGYQRHENEPCLIRKPFQEAVPMIVIEFTKYSVKAKIGVKFTDLETYLPFDAEPITRTLKTLAAICPRPQDYFLAEGAFRLGIDLFEFAVPYLQRLTNRDHTIKLLKQKFSGAWPINTYSERIRLLPLLLASRGQTEEACHLVRRFLTEVAESENISLGYDKFAKAFDNRFCCNRP
ncbi:MAG: hypothetical protein ABI977_09950 [Acidobacteriota bacterium]